MFAGYLGKVNLGTALKPAVFYLKRPVRLFQSYDRANLRSDIIAGITVAVVALPQAIAFAIIAQLPPQMGLYTSIVGVIIGAFWGASNQALYGPANAISLLVAAALSNSLTPGANAFALAAGVMAVMVGIFQVLLGMMRLGVLVNFVSHSVIVGFTSGAGLLILFRQIGPLLGLQLDTTNPVSTLRSLVNGFGIIHLPTAVLGIGVMILILLLGKVKPKLPGPLIGIVAASLLAFFLKLDESGMAMIGQLPRTLPPLVDLPLFDWALISRLSAGALAVGAISLVQTSAIVRSIATQTGQRVDSNQEFVGQGMVNIAVGFFSGYPAAASFSRSAVNLKSGAKTPFAAMFSGIFLLTITLSLAPLAAYLPKTALSGVIILIAYGLIDRGELTRIWHGAKGDAAIMILTLLGMLFLELEFAVLLGILFSLVLYIVRTSAPQVYAVLPDRRFRHLVYHSNEPLCPQLGVIDVLGDLYFGAVFHVEEIIFALAERNPEQRLLLIRMSRVNHCDFSGIHMLESVARTYRDRGGDVFLMRVSSAVSQVMQSTGFVTFLGEDHFLDEDEAITHLFYHVLDPVVCIYECPLRVFKECQNLPKQMELAGIPHESEIPEGVVFGLMPQALWQRLHGETAVSPPLVIDVREPREFKRGTIPGALSVPLPKILLDSVKLPNNRQIVFVDRTGRRSRRAAYAVQQMGVMNVAILEGGIVAWEAAGLLEAIG